MAALRHNFSFHALVTTFNISVSLLYSVLFCSVILISSSVTRSLAYFLNDSFNLCIVVSDSFFLSNINTTYKFNMGLQPFISLSI